MKIYETPEIEICRFETGDIMTNVSIVGGENDLPFVPASINDVQGIDDNIDLMS